MFEVFSLTSASHGGNFLQQISRLQLKLSKVSYKSIFPLQTEFIRWVIKFPKVWDRFGQFSISSTWDISIFVEFGPNYDVTATKTGVVSKKPKMFLLRF